MHVHNSLPSTWLRIAEPDDDDNETCLECRRVARWLGKLFLVAIVIGGSAMILAPSSSDQGVESSQANGAMDDGQPVQAGAFSPDGKTIASCGLDHDVRVWDVETLERDMKSKPLILPDDTVKYSVAFSPDGSLLGAVGPQSVTIWSTRKREPEAMLRKQIDSSRCLAFSPDGHTLAIGRDDGKISILDLPAATWRTDLHAHTSAVKSLSFSRDGRFLVSAGQDSLIMVWDAVEGVSIRSLLDGARSSNHIVAFSLDGGSVAVGETGGNPADIRLIDATSGKVRIRLSGHGQGVCALKFSPDGRTLATASGDHTVRLWDLVEGTEKITFSNDVGKVDALSFTSDGARLAFAGDGFLTKVWDRPRPKSPWIGFVPLRKPKAMMVTATNPRTEPRRVIPPHLSSALQPRKPVAATL